MIGHCKGCQSTRLAVVQRNCNYSAFSGYHRTSSDYSGIRCLDCGHYWRTKAKYVEGLPDITHEQLEIRQEKQ